MKICLMFLLGVFFILGILIIKRQNSLQKQSEELWEEIKKELDEIFSNSQGEK